MVGLSSQFERELQVTLPFGSTDATASPACPAKAVLLPTDESANAPSYTLTDVKASCTANLGARIYLFLVPSSVTATRSDFWETLFGRDATTVTCNSTPSIESSRVLASSQAVQLPGGMVGAELRTPKGVQYPCSGSTGGQQMWLVVTFCPPSCATIPVFDAKVKLTYMPGFSAEQLARSARSSSMTAAGAGTGETSASAMTWSALGMSGAGGPHNTFIAPTRPTRGAPKYSKKQPKKLGSVAMKMRPLSSKSASLKPKLLKAKKGSSSLSKLIAQQKKRKTLLLQQQKKKRGSAGSAASASAAKKKRILLLLNAKKQTKRGAPVKKKKQTQRQSKPSLLERFTGQSTIWGGNPPYGGDGGGAFSPSSDPWSYGGSSGSFNLDGYVPRRRKSIYGNPYE